MNDDIMKAVEALLAPVDEEKMWEKFFNEVNFGDEFNDLYSIYESLSDDISIYKDSVFDNGYYEQYVAIDDEISKLNQSIEDYKSNIIKIDQVLLYGFKISEAQKDLFNKKKDEFQKAIDEAKLMIEKKEIEKKNIDKQIRDFNNNNISSRGKSIADVRNRMLEIFDLPYGGRQDLITKYGYELGVSQDNEINAFNYKLQQLNNNLQIISKQYEEAKIKFGDKHQNTENLYWEMQKIMTDIIRTKKEKEDYVSELEKFQVETKQYLKFLQNMNFKDFFENYKKFKSNTKGKGVSVSIPNPKPGPNPVPDKNPESVPEPKINPDDKDDWRTKADDDWLKASEDAERRHREAEEARKEQEEIEKEVEREKVVPQPEPIPVPQPKEDNGWRAKAEDDWLKASEDAERRHREAEEARKEQEEIEKELEREKQNSIPIDPKDIKLHFGKFDEDSVSEKKKNEFNMIPGSIDMANLFRNNNSVGALLSGIDPYDKTKVGKKISESKIVKKTVTRISSISDKIAEKLKRKKINSKNPKIVDRMKNFRNKFRNKFSNGISIRDNYKVAKFYNEIIELEKSNKLYEEIDKNPGYYRDICDYILNSGSTDFAKEEIEAIEKIRDDAVEVVNKKFSGKGRS